MLGAMRRQPVENGLDIVLMCPVAFLPEPGEERLPEAIAFEHAVQIGAFDEPVRRNRAIGPPFDEGEGPCAIRPEGSTEMDLVARQRLAAGYMPASGGAGEPRPVTAPAGPSMPSGSLIACPSI